MFHNTPYNNNDTSYNVINNHDMGNAIANGRDENGSLKSLAGNSFHNYDIQSHSLTDVHNNDKSEQHQNQLENDHDDHTNNNDDIPIRLSEEEDEEEIIVEEEEIIEYVDDEEKDKSGNELAVISTENDDIMSNVPTKGSSSVDHDDIEIIVEEEVVEEEINGEIEGKEQHEGNNLKTINSHSIQHQHHTNATWNGTGFVDKKKGDYEIADSVTAMNKNNNNNGNAHDNIFYSHQGKRGRAESEASSRIGDEVEYTSFEHARNGQEAANRHGDKDSVENESTHSADDNSKRRKTDNIRQRSYSQSTIDDELVDSKLGNDKSVNKNKTNNVNIANNKTLNRCQPTETEKINQLTEVEKINSQKTIQAVETIDISSMASPTMPFAGNLVSKSSSEASSAFTAASESTIKAPRRARTRKLKLDFNELLKYSTPFNCSEIIKDFLYIGAGFDANGRCITNRANDLPNLKAERLEWCKQKNVCYALNMAASPLQEQLVGIEYPSPGIKVKGIEMNDLDEWRPEMTQMLDDGAAFIEEACVEHLNVLSQQIVKSARIKPPSIFVHCVAGVNRSPMVVVWWLLKYHNFTVKDAWDLVRRRRDLGVQWSNITLGGAITAGNEIAQAKESSAPITTTAVTTDDTSTLALQEKESSYNWNETTNESKKVPVHPKISWYMQAIKTFSGNIDMLPLIHKSSSE